MITYKEYINSILKTRGRHNCEGYKETHHIVPRCLGGNNQKHNLIDLYPEEHYIAHKLLYLEHPDNEGLLNAWWYISHTKKGIQRFISAEDYGIMKREKGKLTSKFNTLTKKGTKDSYQTHLKKCNAQKGIKNPMCRKVINLDTGKIYDMLTDAAKSVGGSKGGLCCHLRSKNPNKKYKGYRFEYID